METIIQPKMTYSQKLGIQKDIKTLDTSESTELFKLIQNETNKYTTNKNGAFINMRNLDNKILWKISNFIKYCKKTKETLELSEIQRRDLLEDSIINPTINNINKVDTNDTALNDTTTTDNNYDIYNVEKNLNNEHHNDEKKSKGNDDIPSLYIYKPKYIGVVGRILKKCREIDKNETYVYGIYVNYDPNKNINKYSEKSKEQSKDEMNLFKKGVDDDDIVSDMGISDTKSVGEDSFNVEYEAESGEYEEDSDEYEEDSDEYEEDSDKNCKNSVVDYDDSEGTITNNNDSDNDSGADEETETFQQDCEEENSEDELN